MTNTENTPQPVTPTAILEDPSPEFVEAPDRCGHCRATATDTDRCTRCPFPVERYQADSRTYFDGGNPDRPVTQWFVKDVINRVVVFTHSRETAARNKARKLNAEQS